MLSLFQKKYFFLPLFIVFCLTLATLLFFVLFPYLFNQQISQRILTSMSLTESGLHLARITPWQATGSLRLGDESAPYLIVPKFVLHFNPSGLVERKIDRLLISSASIYLYKRNGKLQFPVFNGEPSAVTQKDPSSSTVLPIALDSLQISNSFITIYEEDGSSITFSINANFRINFTSNNIGEILLSHLTADAKISGSLNAEVQVEVYPDSDNFTVEATGKVPLLNQFNALLPSVKNYPLKGDVSFASTLTLSSSLDLSELDLSGEISGFNMNVSELTFHSKSAEIPVKFSGSGDAQRFDLKLNDLNFSGPQHGLIETEVSLHLMKKSITSQTQFFFDGLASNASLNMSGDWSRSPQQISFQFKSAPLTLDKRFIVSPITLSGSADVSEMRIDAHLKGQVEQIEDQESSLSLHKIFVDLPLQFPFPEPSSEQGYLTIDSVKYKQEESGKLRVEFTQAEDLHNFTAQLSDIFNQDLSVECQGMIAHDTNFTVGCKLPITNINSENLPDYYLLPEALTFHGDIQADAVFSMGPKNSSGKLHYSFREGSVTYGNNELTGIELSIDFPDLPRLQSKPNQLARIKKIAAGDIHLSDAALRFQIENDLSFFLEKADAVWCNGKIETSGIRFYKEMDSLVVTLYADRLGFSELMSQLGIENTEGEGTLNGKIPLQINEQGLIINDGFLFSTPGNTGIIKFHNTDQLRQGLPSLDQEGYLNYSMKALEDFSYNWTKLTFNNQDEDLLITMQLDGKPTSPLPFSYKNGKVIETKKGRGLQHPIRLDVNIRLPLQELFYYGDNLQSIMENM